MKIEINRVSNSRLDGLDLHDLPFGKVFSDHMLMARFQDGKWGQANKCTWWMPWRLQAMKDVVACDKPRGAGKQALIRGFPNGETQPARVTPT